MFEAPHLQSLTELRKIDVRDTKTAPVRVRATDFNDYIVKPQRRPGSIGVIKEWLCAHFLKVWELPVPDFAVIQVQPQHVPAFFHRDYQPFHFDQPAFGSRLDVHALEVTQLLENPEAYQKGLGNSRGELLQIALFDLWVGNLDRHGDNYNLLYSSEDIPVFRPIDHEMALDFLRYDHGPELQTHNESLVESILFRTYVSARSRRRVGAAPQGRATFDAKTSRVLDCLDDIITRMPSEWQRALPGLSHQLRTTIFTKEWREKVWITYLTYLRAS